MAGRWLILADDLTGAADCAIAFGRRGAAAAVSWGGVSTAIERPQVFSYDADSRGLAAEAAAERHAKALTALLDDRILFKKIDSTLRGQPAAEAAAAIAAIRARSGRAFGVFAPAFPATLRTTVDGRVRIAGEPLEQAEVWRREHSYPTDDLAEILASAGVDGVKIDLATVRQGVGALRTALAEAALRGDAVAVCDAETDADLAAIVEASATDDPSTFYIGSGGLAHALAAACPSEPASPVTVDPSGRGALIVVGSVASASRAAARDLVATGTVMHLAAEPDMLLGGKDGRAAFGASVAERLAAGGDVLVEIVMGGEPDMSRGPRLVEGLAAALEAAAPEMSGFAATGGETAAALLTRFGVNGIRLADEIEPGVSLGLSLGALRIPVVTKAGAFGDRSSLVRIAERLRAIRSKGTLS